MERERVCVCVCVYVCVGEIVYGDRPPPTENEMQNLYEGLN